MNNELSKIDRKKIGVFWFTNDLRLHDQPALIEASKTVDELLCIFIFDPRWSQPNRYGLSGIDPIPRQFMIQSVLDLQEQLGELGQNLIIVDGSAHEIFNGLTAELAITHVFRSRNAGFYERRDWSLLQETYSSIQFREIDTHTLFDQTQLPFDEDGLPATFSKFRKLLEGTEYSKPIAKPSCLPETPTLKQQTRISLDVDAPINKFQGGERAGRMHLDHYFSGRLPVNYKEVRNAIGGWDNSCKLSPWLANGCFSAREVASRLIQYETTKTANDSTYWIYFELLWREYFQWYAHRFGAQLFRFKGIKNKAPLTSFYAERFQKWCSGNTPYPLVNACMNELRQTGYLSNRGRQIVASCLVNELQLDWRYGAAYFEQLLIDYDVASNWGNWQYLAGVGADAKDKRHFNLEKQAQLFDPDKRYVKKWNGDVGTYSLDSVDAADWPIACNDSS